ncbi:MAG TPA: SAM-dependent chlorinase/fluorinase [Acidimicrobiales bacterium]|nr:SAM-dependent chlorinase/fluorinase [Acidimicrobiales bacterium]
MSFDHVWFLSDYGLEDEFVGVVKAVIRAIAPQARVDDVTHQIPPHDIRAGALALARSMQYLTLTPTVVLAVVDPGVGSSRRALAVEAGESVLVGPDNGLLASAVAMSGGAGRAVSLTNEDYHLPAPGPTFAGRDIFAPAAAHLCAGADLAELGESIDPITLLPGVLPLSRQEDGAVVGEVLWVDRFGNVQLNVDPDELLLMDDPLVLAWSDKTRTAVRARSYSDLKPSQVGLVTDSYGLVSIALDRRSAAAELRIGAGDAVTIKPAE